MQQLIEFLCKVATNDVDFRNTRIKQRIDKPIDNANAMNTRKRLRRVHRYR